MNTEQLRQKKTLRMNTMQTAKIQLRQKKTLRMNTM